MEILVVYGGEAESWAQYLTNRLKKQKAEAKVVCLGDNIFIRKPRQDQQRQINQAQVIVLIVSPEFAECMERESRMNWNTLIPDMSRVVVVSCGTEEEDLVPIKSRLPVHPDCARFDARQNAKSMVDKVVEIYAKEKTDMEQPGPVGQDSLTGKSKNLKKTRAKPPGSPKNRQDPETSNTIKIVPDHGPCDKNTEIYLILNKRLEGTKLRVRQEGMEDTDRQILDVVQVNDQLYQCTVYQHAVGKVKLKLFSDDKCVGVAQFMFRSPLRDQEELSHFYIRILDAMLKETDKDPLTIAELDSQLHSALELGDNDGLAKMFKLYDYYEDFKPSRQELPTILHLAARYGLKELCSSLLDMQGAVPAARLRNIHGHTAMDLAREHGHADLVEYLENYNELAEEEENMYQMMYAYVNMESSHGDVNYSEQADDEDSESDNDYLPMSGKKAAQRAKEPDNTRRRFLGSSVASPIRGAVQDDDEDDEDYTIVEQSPPDRGYITMDKKTLMLDRTLCHPVSPTPPHKSVISDITLSELEEDYLVILPDDDDESQAPILPRSKQTPAPFHSDDGDASSSEPDSLYYSHVDSHGPGPVSPKGKGDKSKPPGKVPKDSPVTHSLSQQELIDIIEGVKRGEFTMDEADSFFRTWQDQYRSSETKGFDQKKENLKRRQNELTQLGVREGDPSGRGFMGFIKGIGKKKKVPTATLR